MDTRYYFCIAIFADRYSPEKNGISLISSTFYEQLLRRYSFAKKLQSQTVIKETLQKALSHKKGLS